jgi:hypothetical protein
MPINAGSETSSASVAKKFFDYFAGICIIRSVLGALGAAVVEVVGWKIGALFSRAWGPQIGTIPK